MPEKYFPDFLADPPQSPTPELLFEQHHHKIEVKNVVFSQLLFLHFTPTSAMDEQIKQLIFISKRYLKFILTDGSTDLSLDRGPHMVSPPATVRLFVTPGLQACTLKTIKRSDEQEQRRVAVGPGNAQFMSIRQVSLRRPPLLLQLQRCCC